MNLSNPLQTEEPGIGNDSYYAASGVSPNAHHQDKYIHLFTIDHVPKPLPNAAQALEDQDFEEPENQQPYLDCLTWHWQKHECLHARQLEEYSDEAHFSAVMAAVQYSVTFLQNQDDEIPDYEPSDDDDEYSHLQNTTKAPIISIDSNQGLETQIVSETHNYPESEVTDGCESSKNVPDDIDKDVTDVIGPNEVLWVEVSIPKMNFHARILI
jgi:hypothetical protein